VICESTAAETTANELKQSLKSAAEDLKKTRAELESLTKAKNAAANIDAATIRATRAELESVKKAKDAASDTDAATIRDLKDKQSKHEASARRQNEQLNSEARRHAEQLNSMQTSLKAEMQEALDVASVKLRNEEKQCQALLELALRSAQELLGQKPSAGSSVNRNTFASKFKEAIKQVEKRLECSSPEPETFVSEGEATLEQLKKSINSMTVSIETAGKLQASLVEQLVHTQVQLASEKENSTAQQAEIDQLETELREAMGVQGRVTKLLSSVAQQPAAITIAATTVPATTIPGTTTPAIAEQTKRPSSLTRPSVRKQTPSPSPAASAVAKSKSPSGAKTPAKATMALLPPGRSSVKSAGSASKATTPTSKRRAVSKGPAK